MSKVLLAKLLLMGSALMSLTAGPSASAQTLFPVAWLPCGVLVDVTTYICGRRAAAVLIARAHRRRIYNVKDLHPGSYARSMLARKDRMSRKTQVKMQSLAVSLLGLALLAGAQAATAKGCIKGAAVGAVAGHVAGHHAVVGAAAGCVIGHHIAKKKQQQQEQQQRQQDQPKPRQQRSEPV